MAFVVEMIRGRHNRVEINSAGKLILSDTKDIDFEIYRCAGSIWEGTLFIGENFGWKPMGSILNNTIGTIAPIVEDYSPSSWNREGVYKLFVSRRGLHPSHKHSHATRALWFCPAPVFAWNVYCLQAREEILSHCFSKVCYPEITGINSQNLFQF